MFPKLLVVILHFALIAAALLVIRQQRIETAHQLVDVHERLRSRQRALWTMQTELAQRCRPEELRLLMEPLDIQWRPVAALGAPLPLPAPPVPAPPGEVAADGEDAPDAASQDELGG